MAKNIGTQNTDQVKKEQLAKGKDNNTTVFICFVIAFTGGAMYALDANDGVVVFFAWVCAIVFNGVMSVTHWWEPTTIEIQEAIWSGILGVIYFGAIGLGIYSNRQNKMIG